MRADPCDHESYDAADHGEVEVDEDEVDRLWWADLRRAVMLGLAPEDAGSDG